MSCMFQKGMRTYAEEIVYIYNNNEIAVLLLQNVPCSYYTNTSSELLVHIAVTHHSIKISQLSASYQINSRNNMYIISSIDLF